MAQVLFIDGVCNKPYSLDTLKSEALGGTEGTCVRIAEALRATVEQHNREQSDISARYFPLGAELGAPSHVVCLRDPNSLTEARRRFPRAKLYLWLHDLVGPEMGRALPVIEAAKVEAVICVSKFHRMQAVEVLKAFGYTGQFPIRVIYNPVDDDLRPDETPYDRNKLVWLSSPHKGLDYGLELFQGLRRFNPDFRLVVANPGYLESKTTQVDGVEVVGCLPHSGGVDHLRSALCLFFPNVVFPETFGLVFTEANAVGTPVITHPFGAACEVLDLPHYETVDCRHPKAVIDRVMGWWEHGRPTVRCKPQFRLSRVIQSWKKELLK